MSLKRWPPRRLATRCALAASFAASWLYADDPIVATVGDRTIHLAEAQKELARASVVDVTEELSDAEKKRAVMEAVIVPRARREQHARQLESTDPAFASALKTRVDAALAQALEASLSPEVTDADIEAFYQANLSTYQRPLAIKIWRILTKTEEQAQRILEEVRNNPEGAARWVTLAREHSADKATNMRGGDLGFVQSSGHTDVPQVRVLPALFKAVKELKDGELVSSPIQEGKYFAAVWRRGTRDERIRTLQDETPNIQRLLERNKRRALLEELLKGLRSQNLTQSDSNTLASLQFPRFEGIALPRPSAKPHAAAASPEPGKDGR